MSYLSDFFDGKTCATCAHWCPPGPDALGGLVGNCGNIPAYTHNAPAGEIHRLSRPRNLAYTHTDVSWSRLATKGDFGCVMWERR